MNTCKIDNPLTSFTMQGLVKEDNFLASKQASKVYNNIRYKEKPGRGAIRSLAGLFVFLWVLLCPLAAWGQDVWDGTADVTWYNDSKSSFEISTAAELAGLAQLVNGGNTFEGKTITLANDIVLNEGVLKENGELNDNASNFKQWTSIGKGFYYQFKGSFDGNGHTVSGIYINNENADYQGLFGYVSATDEGTGGVITNVRVEDSYFDVDDSVGGIVGHNYGTVSNCSNSGTVIGTGTDVGGIVGRNGGTVENCSNSGTVTGGTGVHVSVGGIVGYCTGKVTNCSNSGAVTGTGYYVSVGGIVGDIYYDYGTAMVSDCYYLEQDGLRGVGNEEENKGVTPKDEDAYKSGEVANLLNQASGEEELWGQDFDKGYPVPLGSLSEEEREACKIYSVTFTYTLPDGGEDEKEKTITLYGNSDTQLAAPEETAVEGYAVTWQPALPETFGNVKEGETSLRLPSPNFIR